MQAVKPLVSVITPVYNAERFIARCINSVRAQTYTHWEQLIVDDGSNDRTAEAVLEFEDPRIKLFRLPHRGLAKLAETYNHALAHASGELVAVLEGDDFWPADKLAAQAEVFEQSDIMLSWGRALTVDVDGKELGWWRQPANGTVPGRIPLARLFKTLTRKNVLTPAATVMARRRALDAVGGFQQAADSLFVDLPTWLHISARVEGAATYQPRCLAYYRVHAQQTSQQRDYEMRYQHHDIVTAILRALPPDVLDRLRWSAADDNAVLAAASLTRGVASLNAGERRTAIGLFRTALGGSKSSRERLSAILGLVSAASGINLLSAAQRLETRLRGESIHAS